MINLIFPCYNPSETWLTTFSSFYTSLKKSLSDVNLSTYIVNDGSTKNLCFTEIEKLRTKFQEIQCLSYEMNRGKGYALRHGVSLAEGDYFIYTDLDFPFGTDPIIDLIKKLKSGNDIVFGSRTQSYYENLTYFRKMISKCSMQLNKLILPNALVSCQAGILGFSNKLKKDFLYTKIDRFLFSTEFARKISKLGCQYDTIAVETRELELHTTFRTKTIIQELSNYIYILSKNPIFKY